MKKSSKKQPGENLLNAIVGQGSKPATEFRPHPAGSWWREHRTVCLPDFQGVGIGNAMSELIAACYRAKGDPYRSTTSHPAMIRHRMQSPHWRCMRQPSISVQGQGTIHGRNRKAAIHWRQGSTEILPEFPWARLRDMIKIKSEAIGIVFSEAEV